MPRIIDNINPPFLDAVLRDTLEVSYRLDASVGYFNLRGWSVLADHVDAMPSNEVPRVRLLIGMADRPEVELRELYRISGRREGIDTSQAARLKAMIVRGLREQLTYGIPTSAAEAALRALKRQLRDGHVQVKAYLRHRLHAKLYLCHRDDTNNPRTGFVGSSNLTFSGLAHQGELNVDVLEHDATEKLYRWFEDRWNDTFSLDISTDLIDVLDESWASEKPLHPYLIYLKLAYHLSQEAREGFLQYGVPESMQRQLLEFQAAAVRVAARIVMHRRGVMVGDVVGLGKTIVATAIARLLQEEAGYETLIIAPKNLVKMWQGYVDDHRLIAKVQSLSTVERDLKDLRRYRLVIIDESHNLRNRAGKRYQAIQDYLERNDSKVVLLTATPYNKRYEDVANQIGLFLPNDADVGIRPDRQIAIDGEAEFIAKCEGKPQTLGAFRKSEQAEDWRRLMSLFLVRRTRKFIKDNYAQADENGRFFLEFNNGQKFYLPGRVAHVIKHHVRPDEPAAEMTADETLDAIDSLKLPRYALHRYVTEGFAPTDTESTILGDLERAGGNLIGITRTALYKRLSSSGAAFLISLKRHLLRNWVYLIALEDGKQIPVGHVEDTLWDDDLDPEQETLAVDDDPYLALDRTSADWARVARNVRDVLERKRSRAIRWLRPDLFGSDLADDLRHDIDIVQRLLSRFGVWDHHADSKIDALVELLTTTHPDEKVLIFTEYKDTADYVAHALEQRGITDVAAVTGQTEDPTLLARRFSPRSNQPIGGLPDGTSELRVLVATDVLSEGQNLQDAHIVVNYDLPWAIIKIIQRAGRVDRIGQLAPEVLVYSFEPDGGVEEVIHLRQRIVRRLKEHAVVFGSDEEFFGEEGERAFIAGLYDENRRLDDLDDGDEEVDWASLAYEIWRKAEEQHPDLTRRVETLPDVVYSTRPRHGTEGEGVLIHVRTERGIDALAFTTPGGDSQLLSPYEALRIARCTPDTPAVEPFPEHHDLVAQAVTGPLQSPAAHLEGALTGVRKRVWDRLTGYQQRYADTLFDTPDLKLAMDTLYRKPLLETAIQTLAKALRERTPEELAELVVLLYKEDRLVVSDDDLTDDDIRIVSSLGIRAS